MDEETETPRVPGTFPDHIDSKWQSLLIPLHSVASL